MDETIIRFVVATKENRDDFFTKTATGKTLSLYRFPFIQLDLYDSNTEGLPVVYNRSIVKSKDDPAILVFTHDDIYLTDFYWTGQLINALKNFDIVGVAGNKNRRAYQPSWAFVDSQGTWDARENLSGIVGHGTGFPMKNLSVFGMPQQEVKLLDGVFLSCHSQLLHQKNFCFDEQFDFHFYDLDFCRQAEKAGARMGTSTISIVHESGGNFGTRQWIINRDRYFTKWGE